MALKINIQTFVTTPNMNDMILYVNGYWRQGTNREKKQQELVSSNYYVRINNVECSMCSLEVLPRLRLSLYSNVSVYSRNWHIIYCHLSRLTLIAWINTLPPVKNLHNNDDNWHHCTETDKQEYRCILYVPFHGRRADLTPTYNTNTTTWIEQVMALYPGAMHGCWRMGSPINNRSRNMCVCMHYIEVEPFVQLLCCKYPENTYCQPRSNIDIGLSPVSCVFKISFIPPVLNQVKIS